MCNVEKIRAAMATGDFYGQRADEAMARGDYRRSMELNRLSMAAYNRAEQLELEGEEV